MIHRNCKQCKGWSVGRGALLAKHVRVLPLPYRVELLHSS